VVEHAAELRLQPARVEGLGARERVLLAGGEEELDAHRGALGGQPAGGGEDRGDGGLVVGAQDRLVAVGEHAVLLGHLDGAGERDRVEVGAEQDRAAVGRALYAGKQVAGVRAGLGCGVVLLDGEAEALQLLAHGIGHGALVLGRALDLTEAHEVVAQVLALGGRGALEGADGHAPEATGGA
jgi:hypothetical protein